MCGKFGRIRKDKFVKRAVEEQFYMTQLEEIYAGLGK